MFGFTGMFTEEYSNGIRSFEADECPATVPESSTT